MSWREVLPGTRGNQRAERRVDRLSATTILTACRLRIATCPSEFVERRSPYESDAQAGPMAPHSRDSPIHRGFGDPRAPTESRNPGRRMADRWNRRPRRVRPPPMDSLSSLRTVPALNGKEGRRSEQDRSAEMSWSSRCVDLFSDGRRHRPAELQDRPSRRLRLPSSSNQPGKDCSIQASHQKPETLLRFLRFLLFHSPSSNAPGEESGVPAAHHESKAPRRFLLFHSSFSDESERDRVAPTHREFLTNEPTQRLAGPIEAAHSGQTRSIGDTMLVDVRDRDPRRDESCEAHDEIG